MSLYNNLDGVLKDDFSIGLTNKVHLRTNAGVLEYKDSRDTNYIPIPTPTTVNGVTIDTDQTITGQKTFTAQVIQSGQDVTADMDLDHANGYVSDALPAGDTNYILSSNGVAKWANQLYRNENGRFYYLYNYDNDVENMVFENTGRTGLNKPSNILDPHANFVGTWGTGLNDMTVSGIYTSDLQVWYYVYISAIGTPDSFKWRKSLDDRVTYGSYSAAIPITGGDQLLENGVYVKFANTTGHAALTTNSWEFIATPQSPQGTFTVHPSRYSEILTTSNYTLATPVFRNCTSELMNMIDNTSIGITLLETASNTSAFYIASRTMFRAVYINMKTYGAGVTLVADYWNGTAWSALTITDGTLYNPASGANSLKQHGNVYWNKPADWAQNTPYGTTPYYWVRFRSTTNPTTAPTARSLARNGDRRFAVFAAPFDYAPSLAMDSRGNTVVGNSNGVNNKLLTVSDVKNPTSTAGGGGISCVLSSGGGIYMKQESGGAEAKYEMFSGLLHVGTMTNHPMSLWTMNLERARISNLTGNMGIGTTTATNVVTQPEGRLHVRTDAAYNTTPLMERDLQTTDTNNTSLVLLSSKTTDMADGFGTGMEFAIRDNAAVRNTIAKIGANRAGADNTGNLIGYVSVAGVETEVVRFKADGTQTLKIGDSATTPSVTTEGTFKYTKTSNSSTIDAVMKIGSGVNDYAWVNVVTNSW